MKNLIALKKSFPLWGKSRVCAGMRDILGHKPLSGLRPSPPKGERVLALSFLLALFLFTPSLSFAILKVVTTTPDLADITRQIGGDHVKVTSLAKGTEDIHAVPQRPSFVPLLNQADAVVAIGMEAEHAFLPALSDVAQNPHILPGQPGYIDVSEFVHPMDVASNLSRAEGELHPQGNPHYNSDPRNGLLMADAIAAGLSRLDPTNAETYRTRESHFKEELSGKMKEWQNLIQKTKGIKMISHHRDMAYLADYMGLIIVGEVEPKPGIAPSPKHLKDLVERMKSENVRIIVREVQYAEKTAQWLSDQTGAKIATIATMGGAFPDSQTYIGFVEHNLKAIADAAQ